MNRAERRRVRRTTAVAGAGLALTASIAGMYPGSSRVARAYADATTTNVLGNCNVATWLDLLSAVRTFNLKQPASGGGIQCSTITFTEDIDAGPDPISLSMIRLATDSEFVIDGAGHSVTFNGGQGFAFLFPDSLSSTASATISDVEIAGSPNIASIYAVGPIVDLAIEDSFVHGNQSNFPALVTLGGYRTSVSITGSEFSYNSQGATWIAGAGATSIDVTDSYFHHNTAAEYLGAGPPGGGAAITSIQDYGPVDLDIDSSTFAYNDAARLSGAVSVTSQDSAGPLESTVTVTNSTFVGNSMDADTLLTGAGSMYVEAGSLDIDHSTFFGGSAAGYYGGTDEVMFIGSSSSTLTVANSVLWGDDAGQQDLFWFIPPAAPLAPAGLGAPTSPVSVTHSAMQNALDITPESSNLYSGVSSDNMSFGDHGGTPLPSDTTEHVPTMLPGRGSPLIDAAGGSDLDVDQRDVERPQGRRSDIGSVEVEVAPPPERRPQRVTWDPRMTYWDFESPVRLPRASSNGNGAIRYAVLVDDPAGCSLGGKSGRRLTFAGDGTCSVQAVAASTGRYRTGSATRVLTIKRSRVPSEVRDVRAASTDAGSLSLTWRHPQDLGTHPVTAYRVRVREAGETSFRTVATTGPRARRATVTGLEPGTYSVRVRAVSDAGAGRGGVFGSIVIR